MWTRRAITARVLMMVCIYGMVAAFNGWWGLPLWTLVMPLAGYAVCLYFFRQDILLLLVSLWASFKASKEAHTWDVPKEVLDGPMNKQVMWSTNRHRVRRDELIQQWKKED